MKPYHRLSFVIPILAIAGILNSIWAYYARGISGLRISAEGWLIGLTVAVLLNLFLRRFRENTDDDSGKAKGRWLNESSIGWIICAVGAVVGAYAVGLVRGIAVAVVTVVAVLVILLYLRFATRQNSTHGLGRTK